MADLRKPGIYERCDGRLELALNHLDARIEELESKVERLEKKESAYGGLGEAMEDHLYPDFWKDPEIKSSGLDNS